MKSSILQMLLTAADNHGQDAGLPSTVSDLQSVLHRAWDIMSVTQQLQLLKSPEVTDVVAAGARGAFDPEYLVAEVQKALDVMEATVVAEGYTFCATHQREFLSCGGSSHYWEADTEASEDFPSKQDAVVDAYIHLQARQKLVSAGCRGGCLCAEQGAAPTASRGCKLVQQANTSSI